MRDHRGYRAHLARQGLSDETVRAYLGVVDALERHAGRPIGEVRPDEAAGFINRPGLSRGSRNAYHRWLAAWCAWSGSDLLDEVRRAKRPGPAPKPLHIRQVEMLLAACRDDEETALILLGVLAGLRRAEVARFSGHQVDPWGRCIHVRGKGDKDATVPASPALLRLATRMPRGWWFPSPRVEGRPITPDTAGARVRAIAARAGAGDVTSHRLRHTYATELVRGGAPLTTVQRMMRHSQLSTTALYVGVSGDDLAAAAACLPWAA